MHLSCTDLPRLDLASPSDPMIVMQIPANGTYIEIARTEVIWNNPNPNFVKVLQAAYIFETRQPLRFAIYDADSEKAALKSHDLIGYVDTDVQTMATNLEKKQEFPIQSHKSTKAKLTIVAEQVTVNNTVLDLQIEAVKMKKMRTFSKNQPFLMMSKLSESGVNIPVFRSEVIPKCYRCTWAPFRVSLQAVANGNADCPILISLMDNHVSKPDQVIGSVQLTANNIVASIGKDIDVMDKKNKKTGIIRIRSARIKKTANLVDYLKDGLQLNLITAIDFTGSNLSPNQPNSLHYIAPGVMNQYESCICSIGEIVCPYDTDQLFPVYGFGGCINGKVDHCFPLTFRPEQPNVQGMTGILDVYRNAIRNVQLSGPTYFAPVISAASAIARQSFAQSRTYTILLIITDGAINDFAQTANAIVAASDAPLSIIIVGVGNADFSAMDALDGDERGLRNSQGIYAKRDIVQFVPFRNFQGNAWGALPAEVLAEVPKQVSEFCESIGYLPAALRN